MKLQIIFHDKPSALAEFLHSSYLHSMTLDEVRLRRQQLGNPIEIGLIDVYSGYLSEFTKQEKSWILHHMQKFVGQLARKTHRLFPLKQPVGMIRLRSGPDWNFPYTINHCIVIPEAFLRKSMQESDPMWNEVICHEFIHILQRNSHLYPDTAKFCQSVYTKLWGFRRSLHVRPGSRLFKKLVHVTNPDGYNYQWMVSINGIEYWPTVIFHHGQPKGVLVDPHRSIVYELDQVKPYVDRFYGLKSQLYHPHEIYAHLVAKYMVHGHVYPVNSKNFYQSINNFYFN